MAPKKKLSAIIKLQIQAGRADPAPPIGPTLSAHDVNIMEFCKTYNTATENQRGDVAPVEIFVYEDRSFTFILKTPSAAKLLLKATGIRGDSGVPHINKVGSVTWEQCKEIAELKEPDLDANDVEMGTRIIAGTARSTGTTVEGAKQTVGVQLHFH